MMGDDLALSLGRNQHLPAGVGRGDETGNRIVNPGAAMSSCQ